MVIGGGAPLSFSLPPLLLLTLAAIAIAVYVIYLAARVLSTRRGAAAPPRSQRPGPAGTSGSLRAALDWLAAAPDGRSVELKSPYGGRHATLRGRADGVSLAMWLAGRLGERHEVGRDLADPRRRGDLLTRLERVFPPTSSDVVIRTFEAGDPLETLDAVETEGPIDPETGPQG